MDDPGVVDAVDGDDVGRVGRGGVGRRSASGLSDSASRLEPLARARSSSRTASRSVPSGASTISIIVKRPPSTAICESVMFSEWPSSARVTSATIPGRSRPIAERASWVMRVS